MLFTAKLFNRSIFPLKLFNANRGQIEITFFSQQIKYNEPIFNCISYY